MSLVKDVRDAFELSPLVKVDCPGLEPSDYKKIGAKLKVFKSFSSASSYQSLLVDFIETFNVKKKRVACSLGLGVPLILFIFHTV